MTLSSEQNERFEKKFLACYDGFLHNTHAHHQCSWRDCEGRVIGSPDPEDVKSFVASEVAKREYEMGEIIEEKFREMEMDFVAMEDRSSCRDFKKEILALILYQNIN